MPVKESNTILSNNPLITLCGPTAVGKTELSLQIAEKFSCEIIGVDSMQVYRFMDIGTAKPSLSERARVPHYLIDVVDPDEDFTLAKFTKEAGAAIKKIYAHKNIPLLVGGTGLYYKGLLEGFFDENIYESELNENDSSEKAKTLKEELLKRLVDEGNEKLHSELSKVDPDSAERIHPNDSQRLLRGLEIYYSTGIPWTRHLINQKKKGHQFNTLKIGLTRTREELYDRINQRVRLMSEQGLLDEVKKILDMGYDKSLKAMQSIGYRHMINFIDGTWTWEQTLGLLARDTRRYAKRQYTWFNNDPEIIWHDVKESDIIFQEVENFLNNLSR